LYYYFLLVMPSPASERTPLLRSVSPNSQNSSAVTEDEVAAADVAQQGEGGAPQFPELRKSVPDDDLVSGPETENLVKFQENGKLEGVGVWKFRCVFGGILLGYFVSHLKGHHRVLQVFVIGAMLQQRGSNAFEALVTDPSDPKRRQSYPGYVAGRAIETCSICYICPISILTA
jgi:hypothetical protein